MKPQVSDNGEVTIEISGRFDASCRREFDTAAKEAIGMAASRVTLDLKNVVYLDSSALGALLKIREDAKKAGKTIVLQRPAPEVRQILQIANFGRLFEIVEEH
ncbi:MAG TPA: STAS domain-containing protein [Rhodocyclaceae bacterium]